MGSPNSMIQRAGRGSAPRGPSSGHVGVIGKIDHLYDEHRKILDAVRAGDAAAAAELTRIHLAASHEFILRYLLEHELLVPFAQGS